MARTPQVGTARRLADVLLATAVAAVGVAEIWVPFPSVAGDGSRWGSTVVVVATCAALVVRRRWPVGVLSVVALLFVAGLATGQLYVLFWGGFLPFAVAVFSAARYGLGREPYVGAALAAAVLLYLDLFVDELQEPGEIIFHWLVTTVVWSFGWGLQRFERRARESSRQAIAAQVNAAERAMAAVIEERTRIARELHDIVAHSVSVMVVQAGAAEQVVEEDPAYTREALRTIRETGSGALSEMRRVVSMLREDDSGSPASALAPQPGLAALSALVDEARALGLEVSLTTVGEPRDLPPGLDLAAYRIVQEALTNVRRHAHASRAEVRLEYDADEIRLQVTDDGQGPVNGTARQGHGLVGMRERAALYGGRVMTDSTDGQGFAVQAVLPVTPA